MSSRNFLHVRTLPCRRTEARIRMKAAERISDHLHPALAALSADPTREAAFWNDIARSGTPLVEADPASSQHSLVTFVWKLPENAHHVVLQPGFGDTTRNVMELIHGTRVCHAAYRYRNDVRTSYSFVPDMPLISWANANTKELAELQAFMLGNKAQHDPHGRDRFVSRAGAGEPDTITSVLALHEAIDESAAHKREHVTRGAIDKHAFKSRLLGNERNVWVYTPPGYATTDRAYPVLTIFDGGNALTQLPVHRMLDNLLADGRIAPVVGVFIDNPTPTSRNDELPCNETFARFIEEEVLPWLRDHYRVSHTREDHYVTGVSYGGLASIWMGYRLPHVFGNIISQAASLWWGPGYRIDVPRSEGGYTPEWLIKKFAESPRLPLRFWLEIGLMEHPSLMLEPNRRMKALLESKGYDVTYREFCGGHDHALWRGSLIQALSTMLSSGG